VIVEYLDYQIPVEYLDYQIPVTSTSTIRYPFSTIRYPLVSGLS